jgi:serine/threonine-protein kinase
VVTYQLISGRLPYEANSLTELALKQQREEPAALDTVVAAASPELAEAVAISLALDPRDRFQDARAMGRAVSDASRGIAPDAALRRGAADHGTQVTSLLASTGAKGKRGSPTPPTQALTPRQPRPGPPRTAANPAAGTPALASKQRHTPRRFAALVLIVLALGGVVAAVVLATAPAPTRVVLTRVVYEDVQKSSEALNQLLSANTK